MRDVVELVAWLLLELVPFWYGWYVGVLGIPCGVVGVVLHRPRWKGLLLGGLLGPVGLIVLWRKRTKDGTTERTGE